MHAVKLIWYGSMCFEIHLVDRYSGHNDDVACGGDFFQRPVSISAREYLWNQRPRERDKNEYCIKLFGMWMLNLEV